MRMPGWFFFIIIWIGSMPAAQAGPVMDLHAEIRAKHYVAAAQSLRRAYRQNPKNLALIHFLKTDVDEYLRAAYAKGDTMYMTHPAESIGYLFELRSAWRQLADDHVPVPHLVAWLNKVEVSREEKMNAFLETAFARGKTAYDNGWYRVAHRHFQMLLNMRPDDQHISYYTRLAYDKSRQNVVWIPFTITPGNPVAMAFSDAILAQVLRQKSTYLTLTQAKHGSISAVTQVSGNIEVGTATTDSPCTDLHLTIAVTVLGDSPMIATQNFAALCQGQPLQKAATGVAAQLLSVIDRDPR